jgi:hypothetical protein
LSKLAVRLTSEACLPHLLLSGLPAGFEVWQTYNIYYGQMFKRSDGSHIFNPSLAGQNFKQSRLSTAPEQRFSRRFINAVSTSVHTLERISSLAYIRFSISPLIISIGTIADRASSDQQTQILMLSSTMLHQVKC